MGHKILVVTGSPRKNGNTDLLADAFIRGAEAAGNKVYRFDAGRAQVHGCLDCKSCIANEGKCAQDDDMQQAYVHLRECDILVLATPVYFFSLSSQIKAFIDRLYCDIGKPLSIQSSVLLTVQEDTNPTVADNAVHTYRSIANYIGWENLGIVTVQGVKGVGAIIGNPKLGKAYTLGASIL